MEARGQFLINKTDNASCIIVLLTVPDAACEAKTGRLEGQLKPICGQINVQDGTFCSQHCGFTESPNHAYA